ncbi:hypothetical protein C4K02_0428 [Pseudomonas synxantha]|nr:hypothetical protein C4K02_0428 [Pseudomonas synxantha]
MLAKIVNGNAAILTPNGFSDFSRASSLLQKHCIRKMK